MGGVRRLLGDGAPNGVSGLINDWYRGVREPARDSVDAVGGDSGGCRIAPEGALARYVNRPVRESGGRVREHRRASAEKSLADTHALVARRLAAVAEKRSRGASLERRLAQNRLELACWRTAPCRVLGSPP
jgi:hypothetical protein